VASGKLAEARPSALAPSLQLRGLLLELNASYPCDAVQPNPSLKLTRYGMRCKPGPRHPVDSREPGLQRMPPRAA
jgi:hypothetical protein